MKQNVGFGNDKFPSLPGSHLHQTNPALEFVKCICQTLALDSTTQHQVTKLRSVAVTIYGKLSVRPL